MTGSATDESQNVFQVSDSEDDCYEGFEEPDGPGVGTPGFWQNNGARFWNGIVGDEGSKAGTPGFADGELLYAIAGQGTGLLIGDYNFNGVTDAGEDTFYISLANARNLIKSGGSDAVVKIGRDAVATWLNHLAGNDIDNPGTSDDGVNPMHFLNDAIDWLQVYGDASSSNVNDPAEVFDVYASNHVRVGGPAFNSVLPFLDHSGAQIHAALDQYNNTGFIGGIQYAQDRDMF